MRRPTLPAVAAGLALLLTAGGVTASALPASTAATSAPHDGDLAKDFSHVDRNTAWKLADKIHLDFQTFHTEGLAITPDHLFLSAVEILQPTQKYPSPVDGHDRTPGKGVGHLFVTDRQGHLQKDIVLGEGDRYHPGGIDFDGTSVWVPVAEYRPDSAAIVYRVDVTSLKVHRQFDVADHIGGIVLDKTTGRLVGNTWGSRKFYEWRPDGRQIDSWDNTSFFIDYQDCQYVPTAKMICGGVTNLPQTPTAGGAGSTYELGGMAMMDLHTHAVRRELPFQQWSSAGHVMTRNPLKLAADGSRLDLWAAPDNGEEVNGTEVFHYTADVAG